MFRAIGLGYKRTGSVSEVGHRSVMLLAFVLQYLCSQTETVILYEYKHGNSVSLDRCVGIAKLMDTLEACIPNILKRKSMVELRHVLNSFSPGLG